MRSFLPSARRGHPSSFARLRYYTPSSALFRPTAIHRATEASDLAKHPECGVTQEKQADTKHNHHWTEENATASEADVKADHDDIAKQLASKEVEEEVATYGERGFG